MSLWRNTKAVLRDWVWEEKCNNFHLNASTLPNTMGLSFTGVKTPLHSKKEACRDLALMRRQAFPWLVANPCVCVEPFSWLEAAPSTSYYFSEWKGFKINDAIMLMGFPDWFFASPPTKYQSCWRMAEWERRCSDSEFIFSHESAASREMACVVQSRQQLAQE